MHKTAKILTGLCSVVGGGCAIGVPVALSVNSSSSSSSGLSSAGGGTSGVFNSVDQASQPLASSVGDEGESDALTFDALWKKIGEDYKEKQQKSENLRELPGKNELKEVLERENSDINSNGKIEEKDWKECSSSHQGAVIYCGYLKLVNNASEYKLNVSYQSGISSERDSGRVNVVQKSQDKVRYGDKSEKNGKEISNASFERFTTFNNSSSNEGQKVESSSIIFEVESKNK